jgi:hypothetical protein
MATAQPSAVRARIFIPPPAAKARNARRRNDFRRKPFSPRSIRLITCSALPKGITRRPPGAKLGQQRPGHGGRSGGQDDGIKGRRLRQPEIAIGMLEADMGQLDLAQVVARARQQRARCARRQTPASTACRGWPPGSRSRRRSQASCPGLATGNQQLDHARNHVGLRDGLAEPERQGRVFIGALRQRRLQENVARHRRQSHAARARR